MAATYVVRLEAASGNRPAGSGDDDADHGELAVIAELEVHVALGRREDGQAG
jgi:hypothetical protein